MDGIPDDDFKLASIFNQSLFVIPKYQREYSWKSSHINDLLDDIRFVMARRAEDSNVEHYFGTLVLEDRGEEDEIHEFVNFEKYSIVDGQQRITTITILVKCLIEELEWIKQQDIPGDGEKSIEDTIESWENTYLERGGEPKLELGEISQEAYKRLIIKGDEDSDVRSSISHSAGDRIINAKKTIRERIREWREEHREENTDWLSEYNSFINSVFKTATQRLKVTVKSVEDMDEAARMFKVINNRGKDLTLLDKVKSHIVYAASRSDLEVQEIYRDFGQIVRNVTKYEDCGDDELDKLIRAHWIAFAGEPSHTRSKRKGPMDIDRRVAEVENYGHVDNDNLEKWIKAYVDSLKTASEYYVELTSPEVFLNKYSEDQSKYTEIARNRIQGLNTYGGAEATFAPLLISVAHRFDVDSEEFLDILHVCECLTFRYNLVVAQGSNSYNNLVSSLANNLFWSTADPELVEEVFNSKNDRYKGYNSASKGIMTIKKRLKLKLEDLCSTEILENYLEKQDVINGEFTNGWGGIRNKSSIKYLLYEYERNLRNGSDSDMNTFSPFIEWDDVYEIEHLVPKNAEAGHKLNPHHKNRNRLGNLALIGNGDNKREGNSPYEEKYENLYRNSSIKMLNELGKPEWKVRDVKNRSKRISQFATERWSTDWREFEET